MEAVLSGRVKGKWVTRTTSILPAACYLQRGAFKGSLLIVPQLPPPHTPPQLNIGLTYFRSHPGVTRCVYAWLFDMWVEVERRPLVWDQDVFRKVRGLYGSV